MTTDAQPYFIIGLNGEILARFESAQYAHAELSRLNQSQDWSQVDAGDKQFCKQARCAFVPRRYSISRTVHFN